MHRRCGLFLHALFAYDGNSSYNPIQKLNNFSRICIKFWFTGLCLILTDVLEVPH